MPTKKALVLSGGGARGAYQAGCFEFFESIGYKFDVVAGTSVGSINAVAIASGMSSQNLNELWKSIEDHKVLKNSLTSNLWTLFSKKFSPMNDSSALRSLLEREIDFQALRTSKIEVIISAVNIGTGQLKFFRNKDIGVEHVLASCAIPLFFPWQFINGEPYWDGGIMANTPVLPAIESGAKDITVILLSPIGYKRMELPKNKNEAIERIFELSLIGSYQNLKRGIAVEKKKFEKLNPIEAFLASFQNTYKGIDFTTIAPNDSLGLGSILNFKKSQSLRLLASGFEDTKNLFAHKRVRQIPNAS